MSCNQRSSLDSLLASEETQNPVNPEELDEDEVETEDDAEDDEHVTDDNDDEDDSAADDEDEE